MHPLVTPKQRQAARCEIVRQVEQGATASDARMRVAFYLRKKEPNNVTP